MSSFKDLRIVDNFYQTSLFFPMPVVLISTLASDGSTTCGPYSLVQPFYIAGKDYYAMLLSCRNSSNTAQNLIRTGKCVLNFLPDDRKTFKEIVRLGWPGDKPAEKMKNFKFTLENGLMAEEHPDEEFPQVIRESFQAMECTWMSNLEHCENTPLLKEGEDHYVLDQYHDFNGITSPYGAHFVLRVDKILMKEKYHDAIINGVRRRDFPPCPVDYGYRDSKYFWYHKHRRMIPELLPVRKTTIQSVRYAADRIDPSITFTDAACERLTNVPRIFLPTAIKGCIKWAKENNVTVLDEAEMIIINDKRSKEKNK